MSLLAEKTANTSSADALFREEVREILAGLTAAQKRISPKYFYDQRGSELFDEICELPEYYPTRTERGIVDANLPQIADLVGPRASVIEFGAGSNIKARQLLAGLHDPVAYVPVEISGDYLREQAAELAQDFPDLSVEAVVADFTKPFDLPAHPSTPLSNLVFFPGSTIGNFTRAEAQDLLEVMGTEAGRDGALLIGVDLIKETSVLHAAYNDSRGVTAAFNLNVLNHLNAGIGANFRAELFEHKAVYDSTHERIEMRLVAKADHSVEVAGRTISFAAGEYIITEYSHKYSIESFSGLARRAGLVPHTVWTDPKQFFSVHYLTVRRPWYERG
jgi:dimethylhistidine N-methyltransferase